MASAALQINVIPTRIKLTRRKIAYRRSKIDCWASGSDGWRARNAAQGSTS